MLQDLVMLTGVFHTHDRRGLLKNATQDVRWSKERAVGFEETYIYTNEGYMKAKSKRSHTTSR